MHLVLIRHGQSIGNASRRIQGLDDQPLTEVGREQAFALAHRLGHEQNLRALYTSPLLRARQTAEIIGRHLGLDLNCDDRLKEYDCGVITGMSFEEVCAHFPEIAAGWQQNPWRVPVPGEEGVESFQQRVMSAMQDILARHIDGDAIAVVAHGGTLSAYLAGLLGIDYRKRQPWVFDNASLSVIILGGVRPRIALLNDTCHLHRGQARD